MTMTKWGRVLVFANLVIAIGMCAWVFGLYSSRIDWSNKPAKGNEPPGELAKRVAKLREVDAALTLAETRERASAANLRTLEQRRPRDQDFFTKEFAFLQNGMNEQNPLRIVEFKNGEIVVKPDGLVNLVPAPYKGPNGQSLTSSLDALNNQLQTTQAELLASISEYQKLVDQDVKLTEQISVVRRVLFDEVDVKQARVKQEIKDLEPLYINTMVEKQLLEKRQKALEARIAELQSMALRTTQR